MDTLLLDFTRNQLHTSLLKTTSMIFPLHLSTGYLIRNFISISQIFLLTLNYFITLELFKLLKYLIKFNLKTLYYFYLYIKLLHLNINYNAKLYI